MAVMDSAIPIRPMPPARFAEPFFQVRVDGRPILGPESVLDSHEYLANARVPLDAGRGLEPR